MLRDGVLDFFYLKFQDTVPELRYGNAIESDAIWQSQSAIP